MLIKTRLMLSLALLALMIVLVGATGFIAQQSASEKTHTIVVDRVMPLQQLKLVADAYAVQIVDTTHKVRSGTFSWEEGAKNLSEALSLIDTEWSAYSTKTMRADEKLLVDAAAAGMTAAKEPMAELNKIMSGKDMAKLEAFAKDKLYQTIDPVSDHISTLIDLQAKASVAEYDNAVGTRNILMFSMILLGLISVGVLMFAARVVIRGVAGRFGHMREAMQLMADGNFDAEIPYLERTDEIGAMARTVAVFRDNGLQVQAMASDEATRSVKTAERAVNRTRLMKETADVVKAGIDGDFSKRLTEDYADQDLRDMAKGLNQLVANVDRGLTETGEVLDALAEADLTKRVTGNYKGAFAQLKADTNAVSERLTEIVGRLRITSGGVKAATTEILGGANDLAQRTAKHTAAISETSAAMDQLATTVEVNASRAEAASAKAHAVSLTARETGQVMKQSNEAMERIAASSGKISSIIGLIDDIAFQTNLLALNASVEAARAGDAGKGFAVVAIEVRRLAQSAAKASFDVKALVEQSASEVGVGHKLVAEATGQLISMLDAVSESASLIGDISRANQDQASAIAEMRTSVKQMDEMTQHNAALVEETNAAIEQTESQASQLDMIVDVFTLESAEPMPERKRA